MDGMTVAPGAKHVASELHRLLLDTDDLEKFLVGVCRLAAEQVGDASSCGIVVIREDRLAAAVISDARAVHVDEGKHGLDDGPYLHAARANEVVLIDDLAQDDRWTKWRIHGLESGVRSTLSIPLELHPGTVVGALTLYAEAAGVYGDDEQRAAELFAGEASRAISVAVRISDQVRLTEQLKTAMVSRSTIDQAIGIVMAQNRCSADDAFDILRRASQNSNVKLSAVAAAVTASVSAGPPAQT